MLKVITFQNYLPFSGFCKLPARKNALFMFLISGSIEYTNNKAERPIVTYRKTLCGSRPQKEPDYFTGICSVMESYRKKGKLIGILTTG